jgi:hypothetical protein
MQPNVKHRSTLGGSTIVFQITAGKDGLLWECKPTCFEKPRDEGGRLEAGHKLVAKERAN